MDAVEPLEGAGDGRGVAAVAGAAGLGVEAAEQLAGLTVRAWIEVGGAALGQLTGEVVELGRSGDEDQARAVLARILPS